MTSRYVIADPSAAQQHVDNIVGHPARARRGTTNGNQRGGSDTRRRRREWLVATYRADCDVVLVIGLVFPVAPGAGMPACRCYRCGTLLTVDTVTVDRIIPGALGGTYRRTNIRPACGRCNSSTGATVRRKGK
jgi:5-methylcytosine-specific restriction endonuclease McrA